MARHAVAAVGDLPPGSRLRVEIRGRPIVIFNIGGEYFGLLDRCPHQGGRLSEGRLIGLVESAMPGCYRYSRPGEILRCPWHGWEFDVRTGLSRCEPERLRTRRYPAGIASGEALRHEGVPAAETVPVAVDRDYVVVEV